MRQKNAQAARKIPFCSCLASQTVVATIRCDYFMDNENNVPVYLCTNPTFTTIAMVWPGVKHYD